MAPTHGTLCIGLLMVLLLSETVLARCIELDDQIQHYLISSEPPYDNYYNISKAVYPSVDLPSLLIDITVTFLTDNKLTSTNGSIASMSNSNQNRPDSRPNITRNYKWSMSCLYVSGGEISLTSMNLFSLGAIWPNRRQKKLHITLPQFCRGSHDDKEDVMIYFLSTLQDIAVIPHVHDPRMNTAECVIKGHKKASHFSGLKQLLHGVCCSLLFISLVMSVFTSHWILVQLSTWDKEKRQSKIVAAMVLSIFIFLGSGLGLNITALALSTVQEDPYVLVFFIFVLGVLFRRALWCYYVHRKNSRRRKISVSECFKWDLVKGHDEETSKNIVSMFILYPAIFVACHHLLWILLGIITEPFWGFTVLVAVISVCAVLCFLVSELYQAYCDVFEEDKFTFNVSVVLVLVGFSAFVLLTLVLFVVAQVFLSESLISTMVQNGLMVVVTLWFGYMNVRVGAKPGSEVRGREGGRGREENAVREGRVEDQEKIRMVRTMNQNNVQ